VPTQMAAQGVLTTFGGSLELTIYSLVLTQMAAQGVLNTFG